MGKIKVGCYVSHDNDEHYYDSMGYNVLSINEEAGTCWISNGEVTQEVNIQDCTQITVAEAVYARITDEFHSFESSIAVHWLANILKEHPEVEPMFHRYLQVNVSLADLQED